MVRVSCKISASIRVSEDPGMTNPNYISKLRRRAVTDVEVDDIFCVRSLDADCEWFRWVEHEGYKPASVCGRRKVSSSYGTRVDLELE